MPHNFGQETISPYPSHTRKVPGHDSSAKKVFEWIIECKNELLCTLMPLSLKHLPWITHRAVVEKKKKTVKIENIHKKNIRIVMARRNFISEKDQDYDWAVKKSEAERSMRSSQGHKTMMKVVIDQ